MKKLEITQVIERPIEAVWERITDHKGMIHWSPLKQVVMDKEGSPTRNGVGAVRRMMGAGPTIVEKVTAWEPPNYYEYVLIKGAPIRDHRGRVQLSNEAGATRVRWTIEFHPIIPGTGWLVVILLKANIAGMLKKLKTQLEAAHTQAG